MGKSTLNTDEKVLIKNLAAGDIKAFQEIFYRYEKQLKYYAFRLTKSHFIVEEIIQEVFMKIWEHAAKLDHDLRLEPYLYRMVRNRAFNYLRDTVEHEDLTEGLWQDVLKAQTAADYDIIAADYEDVMERIIQELPPQKKSIYLLSRQEGKSNSEIAELLGISTKTVENHLWKTLQIIKARLNPHINISWTLLPALLFF